jgi:type III pantothenate kinase
VILAIDLGNTNIVLGLFQGRRLIRQWRYPTERFRIPAIRAKINAVVIASVVPSLDQRLKTGVRRQFKCDPFFVTAQNIPGLKVRLKKKGQIGADRVVNALAAYTLYKSACIVVDFGTAATFDVVSGQGEYLGGAIAPGISLARDALYEQTAKLPRIKIAAPATVIGRDTVSAMQSGLVFGYVGMVEGMIQRIKSKLQTSKSQTNPKQKIRVIATGGLAKLICKYTKVVDRIDTKLTLKGLRMAADDLAV